jgi:hypothetical protein
LVLGILGILGESVFVFHVFIIPEPAGLATTFRIVDRRDGVLLWCPASTSTPPLLRIIGPIIQQPAGKAIVHYSTPSFRSVIPRMVAISSGSGIIDPMITQLKPTDRRVHAQFLLDNVVVTFCKPAKPRKTERTWVATKGSVYNLGAKAANLRNAGLPHAKG